MLIAIATAIPMANHSGQSGILDEHAQRELEVEPGRIHPAVRPRIAMPFLGLLDLSTERPPCRRSRLVGGEPSRHVVEFPWETRGGINPSQPIVLGADRIFVSTGYGMGAALYSLSRNGNTFAAHELWRTNRMKNQFTSSVYHDGFIYGLDEAILACIDATTGTLKWKGGRYGYGQVMLASGHLVVLTESGDLALVRATPERHDELARVPALEGRTWNHPAMTDGYLLIRNSAEMAAFDLRVTK